MNLPLTEMRKTVKRSRFRADLQELSFGHVTFQRASRQQDSGEYRLEM